MALASDMRSPTAYCAKGIPDTSTMRRPSWVKTKHRPLMTCVPSGFRASGKRSSLRGLAIPRHPTLTSKKADRFGSPPATAHPSKYARKSRETTGLCQDLWSPGARDQQQGYHYGDQGGQFRLEPASPPRRDPELAKRKIERSCDAHSNDFPDRVRSLGFTSAPCSERNQQCSRPQKEGNQNHSADFVIFFVHSPTVTEG